MHKFAISVIDFYVFYDHADFDFEIFISGFRLSVNQCCGGDLNGFLIDNFFKTCVGYKK